MPCLLSRHSVDRHWKYCRGSVDRRFVDAVLPSISSALAGRACTRLNIKMPDPNVEPKSSEWRPYIFARDQWHCRICGDRFLYSEMVRKHIANEHNETTPPSMYEYFRGAVWQRKKLP